MRFIRSKLSFLVLSIVISVLSTGFIASSASEEPKASVIRLGNGTLGILTCLPAYLDDQGVILATSSGLSIVREGKTSLVIPTNTPVSAFTILRDLDGDGMSDIAAATSDETFPNIHVFSSGSGKELADFKPSMLRYKDDRGWFQYQPPVTGLRAVEYEGGKQGLLVTAGYSTWLLDASDGRVLWESVDRDNVWDAIQIGDTNGDGVRDFAVIGQRGQIKVLNGASGEVLLEKSISSKFVMKNDKGKITAEIPRSIWQVSGWISAEKAAGGSPMLVAASEDGNIYMVDAIKGDIVWKAEVFKYVDSLLAKYYGDEGPKNPTGMQDGNYRNVEFWQPGDINGDGLGDIAAAVFFGHPGQREANRKYNDKRQTVVMIDGKTGKKIWDVSLSKLPSFVIPAFGEINGKKCMVVPHISDSDGTVTTTVIDMETGNTETPLPIAGSVVNAGDGLFLVAGRDNGFLYASTSLDVLSLSPDLSKVLWQLERPDNSELAKKIQEDAGGKADFDLDGAVDNIVFKAWGSNGPEIEITSGKSGKRIYLYDSFRGTSGLGNLNTDKITPACAIHDINGDGKPELAIVKNLVYEPGIEIDIFDVSQEKKEPIKTIKIQNKNSGSDNENFIPGIFIKEMKTDNNRNILVVAAIDGESDMRPRLYFIDADTGKFISSFNLSVIGASMDEEGRILVLTDTGEILALIHESGVSFRNVTDKEQIKSPMLLEWSENSPGSNYRVLIDGMMVTETDKNEALVNIPAGVHDIMLEKLDLWGKREYVSVSAEVAKTSKSIKPLTVLVIITLTVLFLTPLLLKRHFLQRVPAKGRGDGNE